MIPIFDSWQADALVVGRGPCPQCRRVHGGPSKGANRVDPFNPFPCKTPFSWGPHEGADMAFSDPEPPP
jgi:hypothetical protein